jgi:signal peptidase I
MELSLLLVVFFIRTFAFEPFKIPANSMYPTLTPGDFVVVSKIGYGNYKFFGFEVLRTPLFSSVVRGDVVVFEYPPDPKLSYIKRVIGMPGDTIKAVDGQFYINGKRVKVEVQSVSSDYKYLTESHENVSYTIARSTDRGAQSDFSVTVEPGRYFVLGDNRFNSNDSRYWGLVPEENLIGKLFYVHSSDESNH